MGWNDIEFVPDKLEEVHLVKVASDNSTIYEDWYREREIEHRKRQEDVQRQQDEKQLAALAAKLGKKV